MTRALSTLAIALALLPGLAAAQVPIPQRTVPYQRSSGLHRGPSDTLAAHRRVFSDEVSIPGAAWLRLHFRAYNLGRESYLTVTSLQDGAQQRLDGRSLKEWKGSSAYFNGDTVVVELFAAPGDRGVFFELGNEITAGERADASHELPTKFICAATDERVASADPAVGRLVASSGCTGWIVSSGAYLTAGHCVGGATGTFQFNVPPSAADGTIRHPPPQHQYPVIGTSIQSVNGGVGNDWAVFNCSPNSNTGLTPIQAQASFYRMSRDSVPATVRATGYGVDGPPPCYGESRICSPAPRDSTSQTQQTDTGPYVGETGSGSVVSIQHRASVTGGSSGGPIIIDGSVLTIGIVTHAGCTATTGSNQGTSFENDALEGAIQSFFGANTRYVDQGHPITLEDGTVLRPYDTVREGVTAVPTGGRVSIVRGTYDEVGTLILDRAMILVAPAGLVTIQ